LQMNGAAVDDEALLAWLEGGELPPAALTLADRGRQIAVQRMAADQLAAHFAYVSVPTAPAA
jgi:hypothetical protein